MNRQRIARLIAAGAFVGILSVRLTGTAAGLDSLPMRLPRAGAHAAAAVTQTWLLGARPSGRSERMMRRFGGQRVTDGGWRVPTDRARAAASALRSAGLLTYAEPNVRLHRMSAYDGYPETWAREAVVPPDLPAPQLRVRIGIVDDLVDPGQRDVGPQTTYLNYNGLPPAGPHGTMVASAAAAAAGNGGVMGIFPGAPLVSYATDMSCADTAEGIWELANVGVGVINISLGTPRPCATLYAAVEEAIGAGVVIAAAAGNDFQAGNPVEYPAGFPHVLSVASVGPDLSSSPFSNANTAVDLSAPGEQVPVAIPIRDDTEDGVRDGVTEADGTSFAAPIVAGAAAWVRAARGNLSGPQIADVLRSGATDLGRRGWDGDTGWGLLNIPAALAQRAPRIDPLEPNDDMPMVNGTYFRQPDPLVFSGHGSRYLRATVDYAEDPWDVYRIRMPARSALKAVVRPSYGDPDLYAYAGRAHRIGDERQEVAHSVHYRGPERLNLLNRARHAVSGYLAIDASRSRGVIDAAYKLTVRRTRFRRGRR